jgi:hypothetical protein
MPSQVLEMSVTYMLPLDHFTGTTSNVIIVLDQLLIGSHLIHTLHMAHATMVPQDTMIRTRNVVISQDPICTPLPPRSNPSLPPGYTALNTSVATSTQAPSGGSGIFVHPGYNVAIGLVPTLTQVLFGGSYVPPP